MSFNIPPKKDHLRLLETKFDYVFITLVVLFWVTLIVLSYVLGTYAYTLGFLIVSTVVSYYGS